MMEACAPGPDQAVFLYGFRTTLLVLHAVASVALVGASTHHALQMRHYLRGRFGKKGLEKLYAKVIAVSYVVTFGLGALLYPSYRYHVRGLYLDRYAPWVAELFDVKEMYASLALFIAIGLGLLAYTLDPEKERPLVKVYAAMSVLVCAVVWFNVVAGLIVVSARGAG
jgi:hypothetical protein